MKKTRPEKQGKLIANNIILEKHEIATIVFLLGLGYDIELIPKSNKQGEHTADLRMLSLTWEMKSPKGAGKYLIQNTLHRAARQSENVIIDLRRIKIYQTKCPQELEKAFNDLNRFAKIS